MLPAIHTYSVDRKKMPMSEIKPPTTATHLRCREKSVSERRIYELTTTTEDLYKPLPICRVDPAIRRLRIRHPHLCRVPLESLTRHPLRQTTKQERFGDGLLNFEICQRRRAAFARRLESDGNGRQIRCEEKADTPHPYD